ncbi:MAG TPA: hypothetical protein P5120_10275 [Spirochaetota bacterium]|nr:hypothetical protein [Spirochaetota bacterium]HPF05029.1 hypothetical protein [Spirochaetota bacterium]HPJ41194.1 hypothetical protein [Spirochaetota bacterium]HPR38461.1 hypothetical protein [Spirochaetota bacterium]HRX47895.1 hypothetical protein [Spirochaetota bacterium]
MKNVRSFINIVSLCFAVSALFTVQFCMKKQTVENSKLPSIIEQKDLSESYKKTGWINDSKYRAVVFILTLEECKSNSAGEIEERVKFEAFKQLQKELNPSFGRNATVQIKNLMNKHGRVIAAGQSCIESNVYFFDLEKKELRTDFINIKNLK